MPQGFARLIAAMMAIHAVMAVARFAGTLWLLQNGYSALTVGVQLALISLTPALLAGPAGAWADRYGLWRPLVGGALLAMLGVGAALALPSLPTLYAASLGSGAAIALAAVAVQREIALLARTADNHAQALYSWAAMGPGLSNTLSPVLAGFVIEHLGFRPAFLLALLFAPLALWWLRAERHQPHPAAHTGSLLPAFDLLRNRPLRAMLVLNVVFAVSWDAHTFVVPVLAHGRGYSASTIGLVIGSFSAAVVLVRLLIVRFAGRYRDEKALQAALALCIAVLALYAWLPGVWGMAGGSLPARSGAGVGAAHAAGRHDARHAPRTPRPGAGPAHAGHQRHLGADALELRRRRRPARTGRAAVADGRLRAAGAAGGAPKA
jgi:predicted MFS family arabinose efflux permease